MAKLSGFTPTEGSLLAILGEAIRVAALEGRVDVVSELAGIVARVSSEERNRINASNGVVTLGPRLGK